MHWPREVKRAFKAAVGAAGSHDNQFPGAYNKMLHALFSCKSSYVVTPNYLPALDAYGSSEIVISYEVYIRDGPVLVLQVRPPWHLYIRSQRAAADRQLTQRMLDIKGALLPSSLSTHPLTTLCRIIANSARFLRHQCYGHQTLLLHM